ncbi:MAG TPA: SufE family protein [Aestuariivirgaceae bacterium]|nr:SufE family protein [Aestuariivirgaceae bacterium]
METRLALPTLEEIEQDFAVLDDWEDKFKYVIELGGRLPPLPDAYRSDAYKVQGCASQVWLHSKATSRPGDAPVLTFEGDSDALIVRGLIAIALAAYSGQSARHILEFDLAARLDRLQLTQYLSPQRSNGFRSMMARIKSDARAALDAAPAA